MLFLKEKGLNIVDFTTPHWEHDFCVDSQKKRIVSAHGWYSSLGLFFYEKNKRQLVKGAIVVKHCKNGGYWFGRVKHIEWENDPQDMFFCKCKTIVKDRELSEAEYDYIQKTYFKKEF